MKLAQPKPSFATTLLLLAFTISIHAGGLTNNFDSNLSLITNGVAGTMWDGVYLGFGDIPGGDNGGDGNATTLVADANISFPGFLTIQTMNSTWSGAGDDGFFLYKIVAGDFDVSVENAAPFDPQNYQFAGLLVRAASFPTGGPFNPSGTNAAENWMNITRFQEFGIGEQLRYATNGANVELNFPGDNSDTNSARWLRITRVGDVFSFFDKTNQGDDWSLKTNLTRAEFNGLPMQVGIAQATYTPNQPQVYFTDFELNGPNVGLGAPPSAPSGLAVSAPNPTGSVTLSWTSGTGSDGSLVLVRANGPITAQPVYGFTYNGNSTFGSVSNLLSGGGNYVVYVGSGTSVTVNGLGGSNNTYTAAVYSYSGSGSSISYNTQSPTLNSFSGPGTLASVSFTVVPTNIPSGGIAAAKVTSTYTSGDSYDVSSDPGTVWLSSDPTIILATNGLLTGFASGSANVSATYQGVTGSSQVLVRAPAFTDNFGSNHDYATNGIAGSTWDGVQLQFGDVPGGNNGGDGNGLVTVANANLSNNVLTVTSTRTSWAGAGDDGFLLYKVVPGDFQVAVHMRALDKTGFQFAGLMARAAGDHGSPYGGSENWVNWTEFEEFSDSTEARTAIGGTDTEYPIFDGAMADFWLLMTRGNGTNFNFYRRASSAEAWEATPIGTVVHPEFTNGLSLQVGLCQAMFSSASGTAQFESFMLDASITGVTPPTAPSNLTMTLNPDNVSMNLSWKAGTNIDGTEATSMVIMRASAPISQQPYFGLLSTADSRFGFGTDLGAGNYVVFRGVGTNVTVTGLTPGNVYYAAVYSYSGSGATKVFNQQTAALGQLAAGTLVGISSSIPGNGIPAGGIGLPVVQAVYSGGGGGDIRSLVSFDSSNPSIIVATNGVLTGLSNGTATVTVRYQGFTNSLVVTVRPPSFTDDFGTSHDYLANGVTNTSWDGVYAQPGAIPGTAFVSDPLATNLSADANISLPNSLTISNLNVGWEFGQNDGFFLFKYVPGDFQVAVHITEFDVLGFNNPGILARAFSSDSQDHPGAPFDSGTNECWISWTRFDEFGIGTYARLTLPIDNTTRSTQPDIGDTNYWLLISRQDGTNFSFYQRLNATDPWQPAPAGTTYSVPVFAGVPMQVGLQTGGFDSGNVVHTAFDSFMLDAGAATRLQIARNGTNVTLSWNGTGWTLQSSLAVVPAGGWSAVSGTPVVVNGVNTMTIPITNTASFYRLIH